MFILNILINKELLLYPDGWEITGISTTRTGSIKYRHPTIVIPVKFEIYVCIINL
tara:strand:- start:662 stop:826 length:165 start_codon:yes stop_codon:yes gene_type:complete